MTSRRKFIKAAGILGGIAAIPAISYGETLDHNFMQEVFNASSDDELFQLVRRELLIPKDRIYLNTGSLGPSPLTVIDTVTNKTRQLEMNPVAENWGPLGTEMELVRKKVADFINASAEEIIITRNTTEGLNLIAQSLNLAKGDEIITTSDEHGGGEAGLDFLVQTKGVVMKKMEIPIPSKNIIEVIQTITKYITPKTKLMMLSHVNTSTGMLMPLAELSQILQPRGIFLIVDGAHAPGQTKVDIRALNVDAYSANGHKWMLGPKETGFLYLNKRFQPQVKPVFTFSGYNTYTASSGTRNVANIIGLGAAIDWINIIGMDRIQKRCLVIRNYCLGELKKLPGLKIISPEDPALSTGIVSFSLEKVKNEEVYRTLREKDIIVKLLTKHNAIRISCHMFISKNDIDTFVSALKPLI